MKEKIENYLKEINETTIDGFANKIEGIEQFRIKFLGKKGVMNDLFETFKTIPNDQKREMGQLLNQLKNAAQAKIEEFKAFVEEQSDESGDMDLTMPTDFAEIGSRHVLSVVQNEIIDIFARIGFTVAEAPEIEDDWHIFSALNFPPEHPARDMQDTFFIEKEGKHGDVALRTHTSSVQVRVMEKAQPPIRIIARHGCHCPHGYQYSLRRQNPGFRYHPCGDTAADFVAGRSIRRYCTPARLGRYSGHCMLEHGRGKHVLPPAYRPQTRPRRVDYHLCAHGAH